MKKALLAGLCSSVLLLSGCAAFKSPSASQSKRNEQKASTAEGKRAENEREQAIDSRAGAYQRQGMTEAQARSAATAESSAPKRSWP